MKYIKQLVCNAVAHHQLSDAQLVSKQQQLHQPSGQLPVLLFRSSVFW